MYRSVKVLLCMCILCVHDTWRASCEHTKLVSQSKIYKQLWIKSCWYLITNFMKVLSFSCKDTTTSLRSPLLKTKPNCFIKASLSCDTLDFLYGMGCQTQLWSAEVKSSPIALWVKPCWKVEIEEFSKMFPSGPIFMNLNYFRQNIWRLSSVQFHFWCIFGTSWTHLTAEEEFTIESVSIQAGCWKDMNEILRTSWM